MSGELQLWVRLIQGVLGLALVLMAMFLTLGLWLESRRLYMALGALALFALIPLSILRIAAIPEPPLLPHDFIEIASLFVNALWPTLGLAWLVEMLHHRLRTSRLRRKYLENGDEQ